MTKNQISVLRQLANDFSDDSPFSAGSLASMVAGKAVCELLDAWEGYGEIYKHPPTAPLEDIDEIIDELEKFRKSPTVLAVLKGEN